MCAIYSDMPQQRSTAYLNHWLASNESPPYSGTESSARMTALPFKQQKENRLEQNGCEGLVNQKRDSNLKDRDSCWKTLLYPKEQ